MLKQTVSLVAGNMQYDSVEKIINTIAKTNHPRKIYFPVVYPILLVFLFASTP